VPVPMPMAVTMAVMVMPVIVRMIVVVAMCGAHARALMSVRTKGNSFATDRKIVSLRPQRRHESRPSLRTV